MTKTKMSTVAIVVLSVLLAAALAATIVLAAFAFSKSASTTITFRNGVELELTGITNGVWDSYKVTNDGKKGEKLSNNASVTTGVALSAITAQNKTEETVYVAVAVVIADKSTDTTSPIEAPQFYVSTSDFGQADATFTVTKTDADGSPATQGNELKQSTAAGANFATMAEGQAERTETNTNATSVTHWLVFTITKDTTTTVCNWLNTVFSANDVDGLDGKGFVANFYIAAAYNLAGLGTAITNGDFAGYGVTKQ